ncbi:sodium:solute symporter family transporter [Chitinophaga cymbidii]|uniref:Sodium:solute symporter n=1 Tax=Chitinophaga cymbidii TaxID=1096750 RepID=A0A512RKG6_9BACT|nr:sodium/solute symporter [Chitinophaga cymbidii]GEP96206.1 sodium:solute symporter [Chitinophaga cymbidii]
MNVRFTCLLIWTMLTNAALPGFAGEPPQEYFNWRELPVLPAPGGVGGAFAGVSNGALIVAGGTSFAAGEAPWTGATKNWYDKIYVLEQPGGAWKEAGRLPRPLGYGVSATWRDAVVCIGGNGPSEHYADAFLLRYVDGKMQTEALPPMPAPNANAAGALIGDVIYIAGGQETPSAASANVFWSLDLSQPADKRSWTTLPSWPGPPRTQCVAGTINGEFYLFSGANIRSTGKDLLKDAYKYTPGSGWTKLSDLPQPTIAAPSPAFATGQSHLLVFGGDDGTNAARNNELKDAHPGFSPQIWAYNIITDTWSVTGKFPVTRAGDPAADPDSSSWAPVTTPAVVWNGSLVLPSGEARPAVRTPKVWMATPDRPTGAFRLMDWMVVGLYFLLVIGISVYVSRKMGSTTNDFFLGGGKIPWWAAGLSIFGSKLSALTFIAIPAKAFATDWVYLLNNLLIVAVAPIVVYFYLPYFRKLKLTSVYEYLEIRFSPAVKILGSLTFVLFQVSRLGIVIYLPALVLSAVTGIDIIVCIVATALITTAYSVSGGIEAVIWTEVMQVAVLLGGAFLSLVFIVNSLDGGVTQLVTEATEHGKFRLAILSWDAAEPVLWVVFIGGFLTQLVTYSSDQVVVQRYLTTSTEKEARQSIYTNAVLVIPASLIFFSVGTALWVFFRHHPTELNPHGNTDDVFPWFISQELPAGLSGLVIAGLFAATMSTISSSMNSIATVITTDFYQKFIPASTDRQRFVFARRATLVLGVIGCAIAIYLVSLHNTSIWDQYLKIIGLFGGCLAGMFLAGIFFPRINAFGAITGFVVSAVCLYFVQSATRINFFLYPAIAVLICVVTGYLASFLPWGDKAKTV